MATAQRAAEHLDVLIIGAGVSGIGSAYHLQQQHPERSFAVLERNPEHGGTWWTHRYPGARSDSDLFTYGYRFKPWRGASIASAQEIRKYLTDVIEENNLAQYIRYRHQMVAANWCSTEQHWQVTVQQLDSGAEITITCQFLWLCQGYYDHDKPYMPSWPGMDAFQGRIVHPQHWPQDLDYRDKRVVVIGSGATAATLIPAMAPDAAHVTMLQRSPTFFLSRPKRHPLEEPLRELNIPDEWVHEILRRAHIAQSTKVAHMGAEDPEALRKRLLDDIRARLPEGFEVEKHFNPGYRPWQQRIAVVPDGDMFEAISSGKASVVTDGIERFDAQGIVLQSGERIDADIIVSATGFNLKLFDDVPFSVDGESVDFSQRVPYRGVMINGLPNMAYVMGYFRFGWTLRVELVSDWVCRMLSHLDATGKRSVTASLRPQDADMVLQPWCDASNFNPGYITRSQHRMHSSGDREPWTHLHDYDHDRDTLPQASLQEDVLVYR
ncbi:flavin-containing monooxygenase [Comamonas sp. J-3]|uniref:flavin-containing monooxygenase n=1 Tax=Comamonas trifloxystrobinivorans TaxID=3350256 RepID=UPI00372957DC